MAETVHLWWVGECWQIQLTVLPPTPDNIGPLVSALPALTVAMTGVAAAAGTVVGAIASALPGLTVAIQGLSVEPGPPRLRGGGNLRRRFFAETKRSGALSER
ncbi:MAG: hypothetical protein ACRDGM_00120 [bacterium]